MEMTLYIVVMIKHIDQQMKEMVASVIKFMMNQPEDVRLHVQMIKFSSMSIHVHHVPHGRK